MNTAEDIVTLSNFLAVNIRNHQELAAQQGGSEAEREEYAAPDYAPEDIPF